tara:strand:- start:69 stop:554 length:486 start_codon:yes stop_codon:yes gene_type:complete
MHKIYLQLGTNLGDKRQNLIKAFRFIKNEIGVILLHSKIYKSESWGVDSQNLYLNQVLLVESSLTPQELLKKTQSIEIRMGRVRKEKWEDRIIDIDILFYDNILINSKHLRIPHKHIENRLFVLKPLCDIASRFVHPVYGSSIRDMLMNCVDTLKVEIYDV